MSHTNDPASRFNQLVEEALDLVKSRPDGVYMRDLQSLLNTSSAKMDDIVTQFKRMDVLTVTEVSRDGQRPDFLFKYETSQDEDTIDQIVEKTLDLVKSRPDGVYMRDLQSLLNTSPEEMSIFAQLVQLCDMRRSILNTSPEKMSNVATRFSRMYNLTVTEVSRDGQQPDLLFRYTLLPSEDTSKSSPHTNDTPASWFNQLVEGALDLVKSRPDGVYMRDLQSLLNTSSAKMDDIVTQFKRMDVLTVTEVSRDGQRPDFLFKYEAPRAGNVRESCTEIELAENTTGKDVPNTQVKNSFEDLARQMLDEYHASQKTIDKDLQKELTVEFLRAGSISAMVKKYPNISKEVIKLNIRTPLRLPEGLRALNEEGLHPDPQISLQIALFAVNLHDWDGNGSGAEDVLRTAEGISKHLSVVSRDGGDELRKHAHQRDIAPPADPISTANAVWIAVATLHRERGLKMVFSTNPIIEKIREQNLCSVSDTTIRTHVSSHCVANTSAAVKYPHRKTYRVGHGMYRLYKRGDPYHPTRESCPIAPLQFQLPYKYKDLRKWYDEEYCAQA